MNCTKLEGGLETESVINIVGHELNSENWRAEFDCKLLMSHSV